MALVLLRVAGVVGSLPAEAGVRAGAPGSLSGLQVDVATFISPRSGLVRILFS
jgi:hypothetical protein